jgi:octaprenyl-diphosphate synthase
MARPASPLPGNLPRELPDVLAPLEADLERVGEQYRAILLPVTWRARDMVEQAGRFAGKRLRPALTCLGARVVLRDRSDPLPGPVYTVAAIVELIHTATLVHDDVLDGASVRRRVATLNARWGDHVAVLVGDVLFSRAYRAAAHLEDRFASRYLSDVVGEVLEGEIHQDLVTRNPDLGEDEYRAIIRGKTAALYEAALVAGAHYGGGDAAVLGALGRYGHHLGMAFQMVDDRLDLGGDEATVGKTLRIDLSEGKTTLPVILWLGRRAPRERDAARALVEAAWEDPAAAAELARRLEDEGALAETDAAAAREVDLALAALAPLGTGRDLELLDTVARFVLARRR